MLVPLAKFGAIAAVVAGSVHASPHNANPHHQHIVKRSYEGNREFVNDTLPDSSHKLSKRDYSGIATYYDANGGYGACGWSISNSDWSVALKGSMFDPSGGYGSGSKWCGKKLVVTGNGVTATVTVADACPGCQGDGGLDMTPELFKHFTDLSKGVMSITWHEEGGGDSAPAQKPEEKWTPQWTPPTTTSTTPPWTPQSTPQDTPKWTPSTTPTTTQAKWTPQTTWTPTPTPSTTSSARPTTTAPIPTLPSAVGVFSANISLLPLGAIASFTPVTLPDGTLTNVTATVPGSVRPTSNVSSSDLGITLNTTAGNTNTTTLSGASYATGNLGRTAQIIIDIANLIVKASA